MRAMDELSNALADDANRMGEAFDCEHLHAAGWVYVLAGGHLLKIGSVRRSDTFIRRGPLVALVARIRAIQATSPAPLTLLRLYTGGLAYERTLHRRLAAYRKHCEWFDEAALAELDFSGCPTCDTVIVPFDIAADMRADLDALRGDM